MTRVAMHALMNKVGVNRLVVICMTVAANACHVQQMELALEINLAIKTHIAIIQDLFAEAHIQTVLKSKFIVFQKINVLQNNLDIVNLQMELGFQDHAVNVNYALNKVQNVQAMKTDLVYVKNQSIVEIGQLHAVEINQIHQHLLLLLIIIVYQINIMIQHLKNVLMRKDGANLVQILGCMILVILVLNVLQKELVQAINLVFSKHIAIIQVVIVEAHMLIVYHIKYIV